MLEDEAAIRPKTRDGRDVSRFCHVENPGKPGTDETFPVLPPLDSAAEPLESNRFYAGFKSSGELNIVFYPGTGADGELDIACGVQVAKGGNASTPAGTVATVVYWGPYDRMRPAHGAIHAWARDNNRPLAGPSWEVYGHWSDDPAQLRTDICYLLSAAPRP